MAGPRPGAGGRVLVAVAQFNEVVTRPMLEGAKQDLLNRGYAPDDIEVVWVPGAFELPLAVATGLRSDAFDFAVAIGAVVRGETPHFDYVASESARGLQRVALDTGRAVGFGVLTCDTMEQATARAGGAAGNKGAEAAAAAFETARAISRIGNA